MSSSLTQTPSPPPRAGGLVSSAFHTLGTLRHARAFHPRGMLLNGELTTLSDGALPLPSGTRPVIARLSKGAGTPGGMPDILGLAVRIPDPDGPTHAWDLALSSAGSGKLGRMLPRSARTWSRARYSSLAPYQVGNQLLWLIATADDPQPDDASLSAVTRIVDRGPLEFTIRSVTADGRQQASARLLLHTVRSDAEHPSFDPMTNCPPGVRLYPQWLSRIREHAYQGSRSGRLEQIGEDDLDSIRTKEVSRHVLDIHQILRAAESFRAVDHPAGIVAQKIRRALRDSRTDGLLRGSWLGHAVHPLLVTVPIGAWVCSAVLELGFGQRDAARRLVAIGLLATPPTIVTGIADFSGLDVRQRRVGALHAAANTVSTGCFLASYLCRTRRADTAGTVWSLLGLLAVGAGGALGGHLTYALGAGVHRWQSRDDTPDGHVKPDRPGSRQSDPAVRSVEK